MCYSRGHGCMKGSLVDDFCHIHEFGWYSALRCNKSYDRSLQYRSRKDPRGKSSISWSAFRSEYVTHCLLTLLLLLRLAFTYWSMDHYDYNTSFKINRSNSSPVNSPSTESSFSNIFPTSSSGGKQRLVDLTPDLKIPATPARETSEFFDRLNNLDPMKFRPPDSDQGLKFNTMPDMYVSSTHPTFAYQQ